MTEFNEEEETGGSTSAAPSMFVTSMQQNIYEYYLDHELEESKDVRNVCSMLRAVTENDSVILRINSLGGRLDLALMVINSIYECKGEVIGVIEANCASAATLVFLSCHSWEVKPWANMMIHNASFGAVGKGHEVESHFQFTLGRNKQIVRDFYRNFLTEQEIDDVIGGKDMHFNAEEVVERLQTMAEIRNQEMEEEYDESESEEF